MKITALTFLSSLALAAGFAPSLVGRHSSPLYAEVQQGSVKWFDRVKGYGFIIPDDDSGDVFVHQSAINAEGFRTLDEKDRVEFKVEIGDNGKKRAMEVVSQTGGEES